MKGITQIAVVYLYVAAASSLLGAGYQYTFDFAATASSPEVVFTYSTTSLTQPYGTTIGDITRMPGPASGETGRRGMDGTWTFTDPGAIFIAFPIVPFIFQAQTSATFPNSPGVYPGMPATIFLCCSSPGPQTQLAMATVTIAGLNFGVGATVTWTSPGGKTITISPDAIQAAQIAATIPAALLTSAGTAGVAIADASGVLSNQVPFTIASAVSISGVSPSSAPAFSGPKTVAISGPAFTNGSTVSFTAPGGQVTTIAPDVVQQSLIAATIPAALMTSAGTAMIAVANASGVLSNQAPFQIALTINALTPGAIPAGSAATPVGISGPGFAAGSTVTWTAPNGTVITIPPSLIQGTQLSATVPAALLTSPGTAQVAVTDPSGLASNQLPFTISSPVWINSISPGAVLVNSGATGVTLAGPQFTAGSTMTWTSPGGQVTTITPDAIQAAQMAATVPAALLTSAGTAQVSVKDANGVVSNQAPFVIAPFAITSVTPGLASVGNTATGVTISGSNFTAGASVFWTRPDGQKVRIAADAIQAAQVAATIPAALLTTAGTAQLTVADANGTPSNQLPFTIAPLPPLIMQNSSLAPAVSGLSYSTGMNAGGGNTLGPYSWTLLPGTPAFLNLSTAGVLSYTAPSVAGVYSFSVQVADISGNSVSQALSLTVYPVLAVTSASLAPAAINVPYSKALTVMGGTGAYTWSATGLPSWLSLSSGGVLSGTPVSTGPLTFTAAVTDGLQAVQASVTFGVFANLSTTAMGSAANPSVYGQTLVLTAHVSPLTATGVVTFKEGSAILGSSPLSHGVGATSTAGLAAVSLSTLSAGSHSLSAEYAGDANTAPSSGTFVQVVGKATASVSLSGLAALSDGTPKPVTVVTTPAGLSVAVTYNGSATAPVAAGTYNVIATVNDVNYTGNQSGILVINPANCAFGPLSGVYFDATGQSGTIPISASSGVCSWSASSSAAAWFSIPSPSGTGSGSIPVTVTANGTNVERSVVASVAGQSVTVTQRRTVSVFADVAPPAFYFDTANLLRSKAITAGCSTVPLDFCPDANITRAEVAIFIVRAIEGGDNFTSRATPYFTDVPASAFGFKWIQKMNELGITAGCGSGNYCPNDAVTRGQMAVFVVRARLGASTDFQVPATPLFTDVSSSNMFFRWIQMMKQFGITAGCGANTYCPDAAVTRGQMAVFLMRGCFNDSLPAGTPAIASAAPNSIAVGTSKTVTITGVNTNFVAGVTRVYAGPKIMVFNVAVSAPNQMTVLLAAAADAPLDPQSIVVTMGTEEAVLPNGLLVTAQ